jgi:hypothetical protein
MHLIFHRRFLVRLATFLLGIVFVAGTLAWFFALPLEARYCARRVPVLRQTPVSVRDSSFTESTGRKITFCGSTFDIPWSDLDDAKTKAGGNSTTLFFDSGLVALLKCQPPREFVEGVLSSTKISSETFRRAFGDNALESDYALTRHMLETTPETISIRTPHLQQGPLMAMLVLKGHSDTTSRFWHVCNPYRGVRWLSVPRPTRKSEVGINGPVRSGSGLGVSIFSYIIMAPRRMCHKLTSIEYYAQYTKSPCILLS